MAAHEPTDYAFPFRIDPVSGQARAVAVRAPCRSDDPAGAADDAGRAGDLPEFGCGLRQLLFAPNSDALHATTQLLVQQSLNRWLADQITLQNVTVTRGAGGDDSQILVQIEYVLLETQSQQTDADPGALTWPAATAAPPSCQSTRLQRHRLRRDRERSSRRRCASTS